MGRFLSIIRSTDTSRLRQILCEKVFEYTNGLGDPPAFTIRILRRLLLTSVVHQEQRQIILEILSAYKKIYHQTNLGERDIFGYLPNLDTGSILARV